MPTGEGEKAFRGVPAPIHALALELRYWVKLDEVVVLLVDRLKAEGWD